RRRSSSCLPQKEIKHPATPRMLLGLPAMSAAAWRRGGAAGGSSGVAENILRVRDAVSGARLQILQGERDALCWYNGTWSRWPSGFLMVAEKDHGAKQFDCLGQRAAGSADQSGSPTGSEIALRGQIRI